jgi:serine/threonine protein kinase
MYRYNSQRLGGTYYFSAPECLNGGVPVTSKADIWSAGAVLYYWTSQPPPAIPLTKSALIHDVFYHCLQLNPYQRPWQLELALHPLTSSPAIA